MLIDKAQIEERKAKITKITSSRSSRDCVIKPAESYTPVSDLCILTCYFNPCGYTNLLNNYLQFKQSIIQSGLTLITVECAFGAAAFHLQPEPDVIQVRSNSVIWQKECLLNVALQAARPRVTKVAWLDADIFFADPHWAVSTSAMLDRFQIVQPFSEVVLLPQGMSYYAGDGHFLYGIASVLGRDFTLIKEPYHIHGHTGYGWAARIEALTEGLFDGCLLGCGDHVMAHAMFGDINCTCIEETFFNDPSSLLYYERWARQLFGRVNGSVGYVEGTILHSWHGDPKNRNYLKAAQKLARFGVDPERDLRKNADGCWEWNTNRPALQKYVADYFEIRKDDEQ